MQQQNCKHQKPSSCSDQKWAMFMTKISRLEMGKGDILQASSSPEPVISPR